MAYYKAKQQKINGKFYPEAVVQGKPVSTEDVAKELAKRSTVSTADCFAVLKEMGDVLAGIMKHGKSVRLEGLGTFRLTIDAKKGGVDTAKEVTADQIECVRVRFIPETARTSSGAVTTRAGIDSNIEWVKLDGTAPDGTAPDGTDEPGTGGDGGGEDPLG